MRVLFLGDHAQDYLADGLFHGLREALGQDCVDVPRFAPLYGTLTPMLRSELRGNGFTLYGLLPELPDMDVERHLWHHHLDRYDLVIVSNIWQAYELVWKMNGALPPGKLVVLDGADFPRLFPFVRWLWKRPWGYFTPLKGCRYFKRELFRKPSLLWRTWAGSGTEVLPISFSIPATHIRRGELAVKMQEFASHIVDAEVAGMIASSFHSAVGTDQYKFTTEAEYYADLRRSKFGVTTRRGGWDCLRHYEIAANGCVPCFRDLDQKPAMCAPHGLVDGKNCLAYRSGSELIDRVKAMEETEYIRLLDGVYDWINQHSTRMLAKRFLMACGLDVRVEARA